MNNHFLPTNLKEAKDLGWDSLDVIIVSGDAYIDHPSFAAAIIGKYLLSLGYKVGIIDQPDWNKEEDFKKLGRPNLFFGVTAGNMDSMVNHYTAQKKIRTDDAYSPDGKAGLRPNRATMIYVQKIKTCFKNIPVIIGGIEASLRRIPHYDFWSETLKNSLLVDTKADLLVYGSGEKQIKEIAYRISNQLDLIGIPGTLTFSKEINNDMIELPAFEALKSKKDYFDFMHLFYKYYLTKTLYIPVNNRFVIHHPPSSPLTTKEMDEIYNIPFMREPHPKYKKTTIPAFEQIKESITAHRGCFGGCSFCAIGLHQGKTIQSRSEQSILSEIDIIKKKKYFKGFITDIGGPSANMYGMSCKKNISAICPRFSCLQPNFCEFLDYSHLAYIKLLKKALNVPLVRNVYISSGVRFDLALFDTEFSKLLITKLTSGHLKLAPEHYDDFVLNQMNKPHHSIYEQYCALFNKITKDSSKNQYILPYLIVGHPGSDLNAALNLAIYLKKNNIRVKQIQEFTPTPMTISTLTYYTEMDYQTGNNIHVPKGREIRLQKALAQWFLPENKKYVYEALKLLSRLDLLDFFFENQRSSYD